tara:strand:- start:1119 stop:1316 length:198 start_codon:yes stop_codon:yes gene_type:complete
MDDIDEEETRRSIRQQKKASLRKSTNFRSGESVQRVGPNLYGMTQDEIDAIHPTSMYTKRGLLAN